MLLTSEFFLIAFAVVTLAFLVKSTTGFGENMVMIPLLLVTLDLKTVLPLTLTIVLVSDAYLLYRFHHHIDWQVYWRFIIPAIPGVILSTLSLKYIEANALKTILGIIVIGYALYTNFRRSNQQVVSKHRGLNLGAGLTGGTLSGMLGIGGPPVILYLNYCKVPKEVFRATCIVTFLGFDLFRLITYTWKGYFTTDILLNGLTLLPAFAVGSLLGMKLHHQLNETLFHRIVMVLLIGIGVALIV